MSACSGEEVAAPATPGLARHRPRPQGSSAAAGGAGRTRSCVPTCQEQKREGWPEMAGNLHLDGLAPRLGSGMQQRPPVPNSVQGGCQLDEGVPALYHLVRASVPSPSCPPARTHAPEHAQRAGVAGRPADLPGQPGVGPLGAHGVEPPQLLLHRPLQECKQGLRGCRGSRGQFGPLLAQRSAGARWDGVEASPTTIVGLGLALLQALLLLWVWALGVSAEGCSCAAASAPPGEVARLRLAVPGPRPRPRPGEPGGDCQREEEQDQERRVRRPLHKIKQALRVAAQALRMGLEGAPATRHQRHCEPLIQESCSPNHILTASPVLSYLAQGLN